MKPCSHRYFFFAVPFVQGKPEGSISPKPRLHVRSSEDFVRLGESITHRISPQVLNNALRTSTARQTGARDCHETLFGFSEFI